MESDGDIDIAAPGKRRLYLFENLLKQAFLDMFCAG